MDGAPRIVANTEVRFADNKAQYNQNFTIKALSTESIRKEGRQFCILLPKMAQTTRTVRKQIYLEV